MHRIGPRGVSQFLDYLALAALLLLCLLCYAPTRLLSPWGSPSSGDSYLTSRLSSRQVMEFPNEHVVLADCSRGPERYLSSQMAYFEEGPPGPKPVDVVQVNTEPGQTFLWVNSVVNETFTDTSIWFQATIGHSVKEGEYAGFGENGREFNFQNFSCWKSYKFALYNYSGTICSMVYDCDHRPAPENAPAIIISSTSDPGPVSTATTPNPGSVPTNNATSPETDPPRANSGLSHGTLIGAIVGSVGALVIGGLVGLWFLLRRRSRKKKEMPAELDLSEERHEADDGKGPVYGDKEKLQRSDGTFELDETLHVVEMGTEPDRFEMDGHGIAELDSTPVGVMDKKDAGDIKQEEIKEGDHNDDMRIDEPKSRIIVDELKARAIDKAEIKAAMGPGDSNKEKKAEQHDATIPHKPTPIRTYTQTTWGSESDVDLAGFPLALISPISPLEREPRPPDG